MQLLLKTFLPALLVVGLVSCSPAAPTYEDLRQSVVQVQNAQGTLRGSGTVINTNFVLTNFHVVAPAVTVTNIDDNGYVRESRALQIQTRSGETASAVVYWANRENDLAVLVTNTTGATVAEPYCEAVEDGIDILAVGHPASIEWVVTRGYWSNQDARATSLSGIPPVFNRSGITNIPVFGGNSGGPIFTLDGRFVATVWGGLRGYSGLAMVVPNTVTCELLEDTNILS